MKEQNTPAEILAKNILGTNYKRIASILDKLTDDEVHLLTVSLRQAAESKGTEVIQSRYIV